LHLPILPTVANPDRARSPAAEETDISGHAVRVIEDLGAQSETKTLEMFLPHLPHLLRQTYERILPAGRRVVDGPAAIGAHIRGKPQNEDLVLSRFRSVADPPHEIGKPFLGDLNRNHELLDLLGLRLGFFFRARALFGKFGHPTLRNKVVQIRGRKKSFSDTQVMLVGVCLHHLLRSLNRVAAGTTAGKRRFLWRLAYFEVRLDLQTG
jgi:hypothetical protein